MESKIIKDGIMCICGRTFDVEISDRTIKNDTLEIKIPEHDCSKGR